MTLLKVDEWQNASGHWYVADVHTWTSWHELADILIGKDSINGFIDVLKNQYHAIVRDIVTYPDKPELIIFCWPEDDYKNAHQFKLDVNRIARKKNYLI